MPSFSKSRIRLFRKIVTILLLLWSLFLIQTNETTQLFFNENSRTLYECINVNPFSSACSWSDYGFGLTLALYFVIVPLAFFIFIDRSKNYENGIENQWKITNKRNLAVLLLFGIVFTFYIVSSANKWLAAQDASLKEINNTEELDSLLKNTRENRN